MDMARTAYINARVENGLKKESEKILKRVGVNTSDAITMFLQQVIIQQGLPFDVCDRQHIPNAETRKAIQELEDPKKRAKLKAYSSAEEMFEDILGKNWRKKK